MQDTVVKNLEERLKIKEFKLNSLLEITNSINLNESVDSLRQIFEFIMKEQLGFEKFALFNLQDEWTLLAKSGIKRKVKDIDVAEDLVRFKEITLIESSYKEALNDFDYVVPVNHKEKPLAFLLLKDFENKAEESLDKKPSAGAVKDLSFIQTLANIIVVAIENKRMAKISLKQERLKKELEVASEMQKLLFPQDLPSDKRIDLAATYKARHEVGGDYYDFIPLNKNEFIVCIADVSGKGVSAAMLMANFQATIRTLLNYQRCELDYLVQELNKNVMNNANGEKFITFFIAQYNAKTRKLKYINAGHNHPILTNGRSAKFLDKGSIGLGMLDELPFLEPDEIDIQPNSTLILYTDGVVELENKDNEQFETNRLIKLIHAFYPLKMEDLNNIIFSKLDEWRGAKQLVDDTAILSCRIF